MNMLQISILTPRKAPSMLVLALAFFLSSCGEADTANMRKGDAPQPGDHVLVYEVSSLQIDVLESAPLQIRITARGRTNTGGWHDARLVLDEDASAGPLMVYRFEALRPTGMATQAFTPIQASTTFGPWTDRMSREIRVVSSHDEQSVFYPPREGSE